MSKKDFKDVYSQSNSDNPSDSKSKFEVAVVAIKTVLNDLNAIKNIGSAELFDTRIYKQSEQVLKNVISITSQADIGTLSLEKIELMTVAIKELSQLITKAKDVNALISDELIVVVNKAVDDADTALKLTKLALY